MRTVDQAFNVNGSPCMVRSTIKIAVDAGVFRFCMPETHVSGRTIS